MPRSPCSPSRSMPPESACGRAIGRLTVVDADHRCVVERIAAASSCDGYRICAGTCVRNSDAQAARDGSVWLDRRPGVHRWAVERRAEPEAGLMRPAARVGGEVHNTAAFVDTDGDRAVARGGGERVAPAASDGDGQCNVAHYVGPEVTPGAAQVPQRRCPAGCLGVGGVHVFPTFLCAWGGFGLLAAAGAGSCDQ